MYNKSITYHILQNNFAIEIDLRLKISNQNALRSQNFVHSSACSPEIELKFHHV